MASDMASGPALMTSLCTGLVSGAGAMGLAGSVVGSTPCMHSAGELWENLRRQGISSVSASVWGETSEMTISGLGVGGAEEGLCVDDEGCEGLSGGSRGVAEL